MANVRENEPLFVVLALDAIVEELMEDENQATVYAYNGSSRISVGSYVIQSLTINGIQHALPTFGIFKESRESLKEIEMATLKILSAELLYLNTQRGIFCIRSISPWLTVRLITYRSLKKFVKSWKSKMFQPCYSVTFTL